MDHGDSSPNNSLSWQRSNPAIIIAEFGRLLLRLQADGQARTRMDCWQSREMSRRRFIGLRCSRGAIAFGESSEAHCLTNAQPGE